jgi:hypothetical protein
MVQIHVQTDEGPVLVVIGGKPHRHHAIVIGGYREEKYLLD